MGAIWIIGLLIFLTTTMVLTLALCRCAALADRGVECDLTEGQPSKQYLLDDHKASTERLTKSTEDNPAAGLSNLGVSS